MGVKMKSNRKSIHGILAILLIPLLSFSAEVCKISYHDYPASLKGKVLEAPANAVSLSEAVSIKKGDDSSVVIMNTPALMFVLDNSGSMYVPHRNSGDSEPYKLALDPEGNRFSVTEAMIDSLYVQDPNAEVGLTVFGSKLHFDKTEVVTKYINPDDPFNFANAAFVTFLQLNKEYTEDNRTRTGYEILKYYLETEQQSDRIVFKDENDTTKIILDTVVYYTMLKNITNTAITFDAGTDITKAFKAVKQSLNHTSIEKKLQYTVFFSDGIPSSGGTEMWDFVEGKGVPTTFTVFFHPDKVAPESLERMNENIKNNNYSSNNKNSELWAFDNSGHDDLLQFMIENVLNKIKGEITTEPVEITINGKTNGTWNDGVFTFSDQFPLTAEKSDFTFDIQYNIITKKSDNTTDIDTVHDTVSFSVEREQSPNLMDSLTIERWDRSISIHDADSLIEIIAEGTKELTVHFKEQKVDCNYEYENVEVLIESKRCGDRLLLPLDAQNKHHFSKAFTLDFTEEEANKADTKLQLFPDDEITLFFQNRKLPLDTLSCTYATDINYRIRFNEAIYYDSDGNGSLDKIRLPFSANFDLSESMLPELTRCISLPNYRKLSIEKTTLIESAIELEVIEKMGRLKTDLSDDDKVSIEAKEIEFFTVPEHTIPAVDSMAPVLDSQTVSLIKTVDEATLTVRFTEPIKEINSDEPLRFYDESSDFYEVELEIISQTDTECHFRINSSDKAVQTGDSLHINFKGNHVADRNGNSQRLPFNVKRRISTSAIIATEKVAYFDNNADGHVDQIKLFYSSLQDLNTTKAEELFRKAIELPSFRNFIIDSLTVTPGHVSYSVTEDRKEIQTYCTDEDIIIIHEEEMHDLLLKSTQMQIDDSVAPVLLDSTVLLTRSPDEATLEVYLSEELASFESDAPLTFYNQNSSYQMKLEKSENTTHRYRFTIKESANKAVSGDSVHIDAEALLGDRNGNKQRNSENVKRAIRVVDELRLHSATYHDQNADGFIDRITMAYAFAQEKLTISTERLLESITLPKVRNLKVLEDEISINATSISIPVVEEAERCNTACSAEDVLIISEATIKEITLKDDTLEIIDAMAPVISETPVLYINTLSEDTPDSLTLTFSEEIVEIVSEKPFRFFHEGETFLGELETISQDKKSCHFTIHAFDSNVNELLQGDSLNIRKAVFDREGNEQTNPQNIKRPIEVQLILPKITFDLRAITPYIDGTTLVPEEIVTQLDAIDQYELSQSDSGLVGETIQLLITPQTLLKQLDFTCAATVTILDKVGNVILTPQKMEYLENLYAFTYIWNGKNSQGRSVGNDSFLLQCQVELTFEDGQSFQVERERIIATKEKEK